VCSSYYDLGSLLPPLLRESYKLQQQPSNLLPSALLVNLENKLFDLPLIPGQRIFIDHFVCSTKGRLFTSRGKPDDSDLYTGGCLLADGAFEQL
jgi:hypothetical protein